MRWIPAISGTIATIAALVVLSTMAGSVATDPAPVEAAEEIVITTTTVPAPAEEIIIEQSLPSPEVDGVDPAVSAALAGSGYTEFVPQDQLLSVLPEDVVQALIASGAVLVIPSEDG